MSGDIYLYREMKIITLYNQERDLYILWSFQFSNYLYHFGFHFECRMSQPAPNVAKAFSDKLKITIKLLIERVFLLLHEECCNVFSLQL